MSRYKLTETEKEERRTNRATAREDRKSTVQKLRDWREERLRAREKAEAAARLERQQSRHGNTGADRVPASMRGLDVTVEPHEMSKSRTINGVLVPGAPIDSTTGRSRTPDGRVVAGSYSQRRASGARGRSRRPRRREVRDAGMEFRSAVHCRDCIDGKHQACNGRATAFDADDNPTDVPCLCAEHGHPAEVSR